MKKLGLLFFFVPLRKMKYLSVITSMLVSEPDNKVLFKSMGDTGIVAFRGTQTLEDVWYDIDVRPKIWPPDDFSSRMWVHGGFASLTKKLWKDVEPFVDHHEKIIVGGHSLGSCCACLSASRVESIHSEKVVSVYTFGMPKLAGPKFKAYYKRQGLNSKTFNFFTTSDPVVFLRLPPVYASVGKFIHLPYNDSNLLKHHDVRTYHKLIKETLEQHEESKKKDILSDGWYEI